jgi:hypothetical protein
MRQPILGTVRVFRTLNLVFRSLSSFEGRSTIFAEKPSEEPPQPLETDLSGNGRSMKTTWLRHGVSTFLGLVVAACGGTVDLLTLDGGHDQDPGIILGGSWEGFTSTATDGTTGAAGYSGANPPEDRTHAGGAAGGMAGYEAGGYSGDNPPPQHTHFGGSAQHTHFGGSALAGSGGYSGDNPPQRGNLEAGGGPSNLEAGGGPSNLEAGGYSGDNPPPQPIHTGGNGAGGCDNLDGCPGNPEAGGYSGYNPPIHLVPMGGNEAGGCMNSDGCTAASGGYSGDAPPPHRATVGGDAAGHAGGASGGY